MHPSLATTEHRPWPLPNKPWLWRQTWRDLLFAHWPISVDLLRPLIPDSLALQEHSGTGWIGVVPFRMTGVMRRPLPDLPWVSAFPELNVRTYVEADGKPGVWFLSLDATNPLAVWAARRFFYLPYYRAQMSIAPSGDRFEYRSQRAGAQLEASYGPTSEPYQAAPGTLEHWLTERYCLYALAPDGTLLRNDVHHEPWPLHQATCDIVSNSMLESHGLRVDGPPAHLHFADRVDVVVWGAERVFQVS